MLAHINITGINLNVVLTFSTSSSEKGPPYLSLPRSSLEGTFSLAKLNNVIADFYAKIAIKFAVLN